MGKKEKRAKAYNKVTVHADLPYTMSPPEAAETIASRGRCEMTRYRESEIDIASTHMPTRMRNAPYKDVRPRIELRAVPVGESRSCQAYSARSKRARREIRSTPSLGSVCARSSVRVASVRLHGWEPWCTVSQLRAHLIPGSSRARTHRMCSQTAWLVSEVLAHLMLLEAIFVGPFHIAICPRYSSPRSA